MLKKKNKKKSFTPDLITAKRPIRRGYFPVNKFKLFEKPGKIRDYSRQKTVLQLFEEQVERTPDRIAVFGPARLSYRQLNEQSNRLAVLLMEKGVQPDTIVGVIMERSVEMIIALLGVWKSGGAYLPIDPDCPQERIDYMLKDSGAKLLVTANNKEGEKVRRWEGEKVLLEEISISSESFSYPLTFLPSYLLNSSNLAYIIYTSGSTGRPKGVLVEQRNLAAYLNAFAREFAFTPGDIVLQQASYTFDTFAEEVYAVLLAGGAVAIADKQTVWDMDLLLEFIEKHNVTVMDCVPLLLNELNKRCAGQRELGRLRSIHTFISGGDVLKYRHIDNLLKSGQVYNTYGPTETTVCATYYRCGASKFPMTPGVPIGKPIAGYHVNIVDPNGKPLPAGEVGELCISGAGVARGYLNRPELTAEKFILPSATRNLFEKRFLDLQKLLFNHHAPLATHYSPFYHTGDLGCRLPGGNIAYMGRIDFQVKIRGFRIELGEIEAHLGAHPEIREATVTAREDENGDKYLAAYVAPAAPGTSNLEARGLREFLATRLPGYMIPSSFVILDRMPLTPAGKLDRWALQALPGLDVDDAADETAMGNDVQETLVHLWQKVLKIKKVSIHDNFFHLGGHSLRVMKVISEIRNRFDVPLRAADLFEKPTIKEMSDFILSLAPGLDREGFPALESAEKRDYYPASSLQKRLYILDRMENIGIAYNIPGIKILNGEITVEHVEEVCRLLIQRHESLRTCFRLVGGELVQQVHSSRQDEFRIGNFETHAGARQGGAPGDDIKRILREFVRPFDLSLAPLFRAGLVKLEEKKYMFIYDIHHIIADGMSSLVLEHELVQLLEGRELPGLALQYKDFSLWQNRLLRAGKLKKQETYWLGQFQGEIPALNFPLDFPPPAVQSFAGDAIDFTLGSGLNKRLNSSLIETGATLYIYLLAVFAILLAKYTGQEDIIVGSPAAGRNAGPDLENIIGLFINVATLRNFPTGTKTFKEFLEEVKRNVLRAFENQDYPYGELIEKLALKKDLSRNPLFSAELVVHNMEIFGADGNAETGAGAAGESPPLSEYGFHMKISQVDMTLAAVECPGDIAFTLTYCTRLFKRETMERFVRHFTRLLDYFTGYPDARIAEAPLLTAEEKQQLLMDSNGKEVPLPGEQWVYRLIEEQAKRTPDHIALVGAALSVRPVCLTYRQLNKQSDGLARVLADKGVGPDTIVGIMVERSVEMIAGLLGIWKAGGAYLPIDPGYPAERIDYMLKDSNAKILINKSEIRNPKSETNPNDKNSNDQNKKRNFGAAFVLNFENLNFEFVSNFEFRASDFISSNLAYIIYTSGSTGRPKGVLVEHRNLAAYLTAFAREFTVTAGDAVLQQASYTFDAFAEEVYPVLVKGGKAALPAKNEVGDARLLTNFIIRHGVNIIDCSPLLLNELNKRLPEEAAGTHLPAFTFISGGDVLKKEYIDRLIDIGTVYNTYGPTESTVCASYYRCTAEVDPLPPIGRPIANYGVYILDKTGGPVAAGIVGELCIAGSGVARGYLNQPELTLEKFKRSYKSSRPYIFYKTGDLGRWLPGGNIAFVGRIDHQVKIRGYRIELAEIEAQLQTHPEIKESVVVVREDKSGDKHLCAYVVAAVLPPGLREFLSGRLPSYMVPSYFTAIQQVPLTPLGKIDRSALPAFDAGAAPGEYIAPGNLLEEKLTGIWSDILGIEKEKISTNANFFHLGGHSLRAALLVIEIHKEADVEISMAEVFNNPTIRGLAQIVKNAGRKHFTPITATEKKEYYPLSPAQKRMYILRQWAPDSLGYNVSDVVSIAGAINRQAIAEIFNKLIRRHESFRTSFHMRDREAVQKIHEEVEFQIEYYNLSTDYTDYTDDKIHQSSFIINHFIHLFDLSRAPLLRVGLARISAEKHLLMMDMHHIISDGISLHILGKDFAALYRGEELPPLELQYKDYAAWKNQRIERREEEITNQETYWLKQFEDQIPVLSLPRDYPRPAVKSFTGRHINFSLGKVSVQRFYTLAAQEDVTLFILLLAVFNIFISRLSGSEDIAAGTPAAGRRRPDLQQIIGMFVNTLALRNYPVGEKNFMTFLKEVKENFLAAFENQDYEFEELVEKLGVTRDAGRNPLFDVMFTLRSKETQKRNSPHPDIQDIPPSYDYAHRVARFDLILLAVEDADELFFTLEYSTELFKEETAEQFVRYFKSLVSSILENPGRRLSEFRLITPLEKQELLYGFNNAAGQYPADKTIPGLFSEQAARTPDRIAVLGESVRPVGLSYKKINEQSAHLARVLIEKGVLADNIVAIQMERSLEMIIGILGILRAGGAYMPIDPGYPEERIDYMLKDSGARLLVTTINKECEKVRRWEGETLLLGEPSKTPESFSYPLTFLPSYLLNSSNLAYIVYTSGSTGKPKGVLTTHANVVRVVKDANYIELTERDRILQLSNYAFDGSVFDIYGALLNGAALILPDKEQTSSVHMLADLIKRERITVFFVTTALFNTLVDAAPDAFKNIRKVLFGGERVSVEHAGKALAYMGKGRIVHMYGPTETTVFATYYNIAEIEARAGTIPIGRPASATSVYILDNSMNPAPIGITGEIFIGGGGVARGYLNNPELTADRFNRSHRSYKSYILYKTGDLGRWLPDGNIEFIERKDHQVKIRGFRIEIGEIENRLLNHEAIKEAVVTIREKNDDKYLCAYYILSGAAGKKPGAAELKQYLAERLPAYMVPAYFTPMEKFPLNPNGKVDTKRLPAPDAGEPAGDYAAPRDEVEEKLTQIWAEVLGVDRGIIGINANFFQLGGHSLKAIIMTDRIQLAFNVKVQLADLFQRQVIKSLAESIRIKRMRRETRETETIEAAEAREYYPLTPEQERMFERHRFYGLGNTIFNMPWVGELEDTGGETLEKAFAKLIERHESLRTSFLLVDGAPVQVIHKQVDFKIEYFDLAAKVPAGHPLNAKDREEKNLIKVFAPTFFQKGGPPEAIIQSFIHPFDLSRAPLLRVAAVNKGGGKIQMLMDMHHIVSDGSSFGVLIRELKTLVKGGELAALRIQYKDYVQWQESEERKKDLEKQADYWQKLLEKRAPGLALPLDFPRPAIRRMAAGVIDFEMDRKEVKTLRELAKNENCSFFMVMLALFNVLLFKLTGREDILVSTFIAGRRGFELQEIVGMFVNTLLLRNYPTGEKHFKVFLNEVKQQTLNAYENQDYPLGLLLKRLAPNGRRPLPVDVNFVLQNLDPSESLMSGFQAFQSAGAMNGNENEKRLSFYDLRFEGFELEERLIFNVEYDMNLFKEDTVRGFISDFKKIVSSVLRDPGKRISAIY